MTKYETYLSEKLLISSFNPCKAVNHRVSAFRENSQKGRQKPPKSPEGEIATRHKGKFCIKLNSKRKNGITIENWSTQSILRAIRNSSFDMNLIQNQELLTLDCVDQFSIVIPFFHSEFNFLQNLPLWRVAISLSGDFGGFWRPFWLFSQKALTLWFSFLHGWIDNVLTYP